MSGGLALPWRTGETTGRFASAVGFTKRTLRAHFGIDARALAAFRISLGALLLANVLLRARYLTAFYTDAGVFPRSVMSELYPAAATLSVHGQFGSAEAQAVLFAAAGVAALSVLVGYRTTLATVVSLALLFSLHGRNPLVLNGGDILLRHLTFWAIFLPLSERWSVAAVGRERPARDRIASVATAGLIFQVFVVYAVNAVMKHQGALWREGTATQYIFQLDQFTVLFGDAIGEIGPLVTLFGVVWFWLLTASALLFVLRGWPRAVFATLFVGAHAAMALTMQLGLFPLISIAGLLVFYPGSVWDRVERRVVDPLRNGATRVGTWIERARSRPTVVPAAWRARVNGLWTSYLVPAVALIAILAMVVTNVGSVTTVDMGPVEVTDMTDQSPRWNMFAPNPLRTGVWYVLAGTTAGGEQIDAMHGGNVSYDRPPDMAHTYHTARWRKYFSHVDSHVGENQIQESLSTYLCRQHDGESALESITVTKMSADVSLDGKNEVSRTTLGTYNCPDG